MKGRWLARVLIGLGALIALIWIAGPREPADLNATFDESLLAGDVEGYFAQAEARVPNVTPGVEKRVIRAPDSAGRRTPVSVLYVHGFSATSEELRPVPDRIAAALGANLVYTRLQGHGRDGAAMAEATVAGWMTDMAEALAAARAVGDRVVVIGTSTGGTLAAAAALDPEMSRGVAAMILVSPNFGINSAGAGMLTWPAARWWLPLVTGRERRWQPLNDAQARYWTYRYPVTALLPMAALVETVTARDFTGVTIPALFWFSPQDGVVSPDRTEAIAASWGGPASVHRVTVGPDDDPLSHVIAGEILSPGQTEAAVAGMLDWLGTVLD